MWRKKQKVVLKRIRDEVVIGDWKKVSLIYCANGTKNRKEYGKH